MEQGVARAACLGATVVGVCKNSPCHSSGWSCYCNCHRNILNWPMLPGCPRCPSMLLFNRAWLWENIYFLWIWLLTPGERGFNRRKGSCYFCLSMKLLLEESYHRQPGLVFRPLGGGRSQKQSSKVSKPRGNDWIRVQSQIKSEF